MLVTRVVLLLTMKHRVEEALAIANFVFTAAFTLEMLLKMGGLGAWNYLRDPWNLFDTLVVAVSLVELVTELMARTSSGGLTALRWVTWGGAPGGACMSTGMVRRCHERAGLQLRGSAGGGLSVQSFHVADYGGWSL